MYFYIGRSDQGRIGEADFRRFPPSIPWAECSSIRPHQGIGRGLSGGIRTRSKSKVSFSLVLCIDFGIA